MRVLQINSVCGINSNGRIATDLDEILKEQGYESFIAFGRNEPNNCDTTLRIGALYDNYTHVALTRLLDRHGFGSKKATMDFIKKVEALNPDLIHLHNIHGYYINIKILFNYLKQSNKPVVWTLHDCWAFTGHCAYFTYAGCNKWKTECYNCIQKKEYPASQLVDASKENFRKKKELFTGLKNMKIVVPSNWLADLVQKSFLCKYPIKVINNGIDLKIFKPTESNFRQKYNLEEKFIILGVACTWNKRKGFEHFLRLSEWLKGDEAIVMVGLTEKQLKSLPKNIIGIVKTNSTKELAEIYSAADLFLNLTLEDNFPTTNLEAMACGTPVITYKTGGSVESVDRNTGIVVEKGNLKAVKSSIAIIKETNALNYKSQCISRVVSKYEKRKTFNDYIKMYHSIEKVDS